MSASAIARGTSLRARYAVSGTHIAYAGRSTHDRVHGTRKLRSGGISAPYRPTRPIGGAAY
eukprot:3813365-Rhodomonas_salina.3